MELDCLYSPVDAVPEMLTKIQCGCVGRASFREVVYLV